MNVAVVGCQHGWRQEERSPGPPRPEAPGRMGASFTKTVAIGAAFDAFVADDHLHSPPCSILIFILAHCKPVRPASEVVVMERSAVLERHPQLYFTDGEIVLAARVSQSSTLTPGSPSRYQLYRVHKPVLRHNSTVYANLFADAAPEELYDGVPLVMMMGDAAEDLASLLTFIYNPSYVSMQLLCYFY